MTESLTAVLWRREQVAHCSASLATYLGITVEDAEELLLSEAYRRRVSVGLLAHHTRRNTAPARSWRVAACVTCGAPGQLQVAGEWDLARELVCPKGHGGVCRPRERAVQLT